MRRLPRLPAPAAGLVPSSSSMGLTTTTTTTTTALRAPAASVTGTAWIPSPRLGNDRRHLSTTAPNAARLKKPTFEFDLDLAPEHEPETHTRRQPVAAPFRYPCGRRNAPRPDELDNDATYRPAETADGLEEVGGLADWWDKPEHWGPKGAAEYVRSVVGWFGPVEKVTDPALLEVLVKRAVVEALAVARSAKGRSLEARAEVEQVFAHTANGAYKLQDIVAVSIQPSGSEVATLEKAEAARVWDVLRGAVPPDGAAGQAKKKKKRLLQRTLVRPEHAQELIDSPSWDKGWKKAVLRNAVAKFWAAKRIQQLTGHHIADSKLIGDVTVGAILKMLEEPVKPPKLAELLQNKAAFEGLPNVRVFPRRVTPIDKDKMEGRWKIITRELKERDLPIIGTGGYSGAVEKRWVEGK
ncbi:hypothetical protein VTJ83DRAFT_5338 [Remersonia thermophila]|uniref:Large ribosomal subunit protein mL50 n=1 Tax=Remersonia thermophila TaxID=72144 RepID=A0ABR4D804_9PEZI